MKNGRMPYWILPFILDKRSGFPFPPVAQIVVEIDEHVGTVYEAVHHGGHDKRGGYVKHGVLFDEHGR